MKQIFFIILFGLNPTGVFAQWSYGVKAGLNVNYLKIKNPGPLAGADTDKTVGFHLGVYSSLNVSNKIAVVPEVQLMNKRVGIADGYNYNLYYLDVPVLVSYSLLEQLAIDIGPNLGYLISARATGGGRNNNITDLYERIDIGLTAGLRLELIKKLSVIGRYYHGLSSVQDVYYSDANNAREGKATFHNRNISLGIGYLIK